ncbi:hypothetical protein ABZP36_001493 [Zizania latifolia]
MVMAMSDVFAQSNISRRIVPGYEAAAHLSNPGEWGAWAHCGHRLWASMSEEFWMHVYKVQRCPRSASHDWTSCPYAHKGERARRRDPRRFVYAAVSCPDYRASQLVGGGAPPSCAHGLRCRYAHGVFELWLHPSRFRTRMCTAGPRCARPICFFAHYATELRDDHNAIVSAVLTPPLPARVLKRPAAADANPRVSAAADHHRRHLDLIEEAMRFRLRLYSDPDTPPPSSSSTAVATTTPAAPVLTLAGGNGEGSVGRGNCRRCRAEEEDYVLNGYEHYDLIMDLVN